MELKPLEAYTLSYAEYTTMAKEELTNLLDRYRVLGIEQLLMDTGDLLIIPKEN